ncbi:alpha/beta fold hydrolase [Flammeovirga aprica]|uniref:Alpha/beta hydrolase n=1 Tax=Flammeovirga aprica JL-4 TaxID=694437 RepID=A0A7X9RV83_9BACT|nr:alpha/beta hydrolase [Flammeovirga aprica]NME69249.1 alpha/beta hydrolase [Flammeovirga aprica JL-4]
MTYPELVDKAIVIGANLNPKTIKAETIEKVKLRLENNPKDSLAQLILTQPNINPKALNTIPNEVMVIAGENDVIKIEHTQLIHSSIKNSKLCIIPNATHYVPWEQATIINKAILDFLMRASE